MGRWSVVLAAAAALGVLAVGASAGAGGRAEDDAGLSLSCRLPARGDAPALRSAHLRMLSDDVLQVEAEYDREIPAVPKSTLIFVWAFDLDCDAATGRPFDDIGAECFVRVAFYPRPSHNPAWMGTMDWLAERGGRPPSGYLAPVAVHIDGRRIAARVPMANLGGARTVRWGADSCGMHATAAGSVRLSAPSAQAGRVAAAYLGPLTVALRNGDAAAEARLLLYDGAGAELPAAGHTVRLWSSNAEAGLTLEGLRIAATPGRWGRATVTARVDGVVSNPVEVCAGRAEVWPAVVHLSPASGMTGRVTAALRDAWERPIPLAGHAVEYRAANAEVATVDHEGQVAARPGDAFTTVDAWIDGHAAYSWACVRVLPRAAAPAILPLAGRHSTLWMPAAVTINPAFGPIEAMYRRYQLPHVADVVYALQAELTGQAGWGGAAANLTALGAESEANVVCGLSGNPALLGFLVPLPHPSVQVIQLDNGEPHWGIWFHEMAHGMNPLPPWVQGMMEKFAGASAGRYGEAMTTFLKSWAMHAITGDPARYGVGDSVRRAMAGDSYAALAFDRRVFGRDLERYIAGGARFENLDANVFDGILFALSDRYGWGWLPRFYDAFRFPDALRRDMVKDDADLATLMCAGISAAIGQDLRETFRRRWGFPVQDAHYEWVKPLLDRQLTVGARFRALCRPVSPPAAP